MTFTNDPAAVTGFYVCHKFLTHKKMNKNVSSLWSLNNNSTLPIILRYPILKLCKKRDVIRLMDIFDRGIVMSFSMIMQKDEIPSSHSADFYYSGITQMQFGEMN